MSFLILLLAVVVVVGVLLPSDAFQPVSITRGKHGVPHRSLSSLLKQQQTEKWSGEVVTDEDGKIKGCTITSESETLFTIQIDGEAADLGNFGSVVYRKITNDAKRQSFVGFRPGTLPPHLLPTYKAFAMNEVAIEATLEAMQQNDIRPFESAREEIVFEQISIPPRKQKNKKKKKSRKKKEANTNEAVVQVEDEDEKQPPAWETFDTMQEALKAGWEVRNMIMMIIRQCILVLVVLFEHISCSQQYIL